MGQSIASNPEIRYVSGLGFRVANVTVNGTEGLVELEVSHGGDLAGLGGDHEPDQWVLLATSKSGTHREPRDQVLDGGLASSLRSLL